MGIGGPFAFDGTLEQDQVVRPALVAFHRLCIFDLQPALARADVGIKSIDKSVGSLRKAIVYRDDAPIVDRYLAIEGYLRGLVTGTPGASSGTVRLVRA